MGEAGLVDWILAAATLAAAKRGGLCPLRMAQAMGFLVLGVLASLVWLRMGSVDVGLAEAGLGGGLLGAVLVILAAAPQRAPSSESRGMPAAPAALFGTVAGVLITLVLGAAWLRAAPALEQQSPGWSEPLAEQLPSTGVEHGITGCSWRSGPMTRCWSRGC
ncbi:hypothetical protein [Nesterenkonia pannonica]|uniref:hypothetical protein n=1 Tax=Nesterenkonia pannonica TaxID=1548602 RepID=UPI0021644FDE|nr:hypothetical protein [Nesterenkonia pannonica]